MSRYNGGRNRYSNENNPGADNCTDCNMVSLQPFLVACRLSRSTDQAVVLHLTRLSRLWRSTGMASAAIAIATSRIDL